MHNAPLLSETCEQILREQEPNFLRLYLNLHVAQTCFCLDRYVSTTWPVRPTGARQPRGRSEDCQSFLANGLEEALSGAIKLARYNQHTTRSRSIGLILDPSDRLTGFASEALPGGDTAQFLPGLRVVGKKQLDRAPGALSLEHAAANGYAEFDDARLGLLVLVAGADDLLDKYAESIRSLARRNAPLVITCVDRENLAALRGGSTGLLHEIAPDIVVFDESFVDHAVPFSAFTARKSLFACWNRPGKSTFHSTTFQPNTISTLHFMRCLAQADPDFHDRYADLLQQAHADLARRAEWFGRYYNPAFYRLIRATGFATGSVRASGSFVVVNGRPIFDAISGVACSFRGHNPPAYGDELKTLEFVRARENTSVTAGSADSGLAGEAELRRRLESLTGLEHFVPAVSGATAVESALKMALVAQFPRRHVLALKAGFGGKTLFALTGTANPYYKARIDHLYSDVYYVDPFARDALARIDALLAKHDFAVVQVELIQSVGGVRPIPENVIRHLDAGRERWGYLLLVDEVQTGMYRTGPFTLSKSLDLAPDFLLLGKATSDMMFPFALTLYSAAVRDLLERRGSDLIRVILNRYGYEQGYKTVVDVLRLGEAMGISRRVADAGALFAQLLSAGLGDSTIVRDVRVFGLLIGIELDKGRWPHGWFSKRLSSFYLLNMLRHAQFPMMAGFCQYEPNVLKITPPLNTSPDEIRRSCATIVDVLTKPLHKVLATGLGALIHSRSIGRTQHEYADSSVLEPAER